MSKDISLKSIKIKPLVGNLYKKYRRHTVFAVILLVLLSYIFVVFRISQLSAADPSDGQVAGAPLTIPKVDQKVINHIQSLEDNNTQIHSLFEKAQQQQSPFGG
ncbi:hypothetical protein KW792_01195 [Candidatus Saccharibacteria bacterium]|nr:hypothetical protein [Candidatus Saccharibacteria bacterium]